MRCRTFQTVHGNAVVCGNFHAPAACMKCGRAASRLCDWKINTTKTCDAALCDDCTYEPGTDKDLCPRHKEMWLEHLEQKKEPKSKKTN